MDFIKQYRNFSKISLPKWPECRVRGEDVTRDQAAAILIRTQDFYFSTNDHDFQKQLYQTLGVKIQKDYPYCSWEEMESLMAEYKCLNLNYIQNRRICSAYIGGPHGWMNWGGSIYQVGVNIGKWPCVEDVYNDWCLVAEAFPFIDLKCQLFNKEGCEEGGEPLIEFQLKNGRVTLCEPGEPIDTFGWSFENHTRNIGDLRTERGCTKKTFYNALVIAKNSID